MYTFLVHTGIGFRFRHKELKSTDFKEYTRRERKKTRLVISSTSSIKDKYTTVDLKKLFTQVDIT